MQTPNVAAVKNNATVLANAAALTYAILVEINGESLTRDRVEQMVAMKLSDSIQTNP